MASSGAVGTSGGAGTRMTIALPSSASAVALSRSDSKGSECSISSSGYNAYERGTELLSIGLGSTLGDGGWPLSRTSSTGSIFGAGGGSGASGGDGQLQAAAAATSLVEHIINQRFLQWMALSSTQEGILGLINDLKAGKTLNLTPGTTFGAMNASGSGGASGAPHGSTHGASGAASEANATAARTLLLSPRRLSTGSGTSPGASAAAAAATMNHSGGRTPPLSPTAERRASPQGGLGGSRSPTPSSPQHFTFPGTSPPLSFVPIANQCDWESAPTTVRAQSISSFFLPSLCTAGANAVVGADDVFPTAAMVAAHSPSALASPHHGRFGSPPAAVMAEIASAAAAGGASGGTQHVPSTLSSPQSASSGAAGGVALLSPQGAGQSPQSGIGIAMGTHGAGRAVLGRAATSGTPADRSLSGSSGSSSGDSSGPSSPAYSPRATAAGSVSGEKDGTPTSPRRTAARNAVAGAAGVASGSPVAGPAAVGSLASPPSPAAVPSTSAGAAGQHPSPRGITSPSGSVSSTGSSASPRMLSPAASALANEAFPVLASPPAGNSGSPGQVGGKPGGKAGLTSPTGVGKMRSIGGATSEGKLDEAAGAIGTVAAEGKVDSVPAGEGRPAEDAKDDVAPGATISSRAKLSQETVPGVSIAPAAEAHAQARPTIVVPGAMATPATTQAAAAAASAAGPPAGTAAAVLAAVTSPPKPHLSAVASPPSAGTRKSTSGVPVGALAAACPAFYKPGEGGRGRGKPLPNESLEDKLPAILELFRKHNVAPAAPAVPAPPPGLKARRNSRTSLTGGSKPGTAAAVGRAGPGARPGSGKPGSLAGGKDAKAKAGTSAGKSLPRTNSGRSVGSTSTGSDGDAGSDSDGDAAASSPGKVVVSVAGVKVSWEDAHSGLPVEHFAAVAKTLCGFPSFFAAPLFRRVRSQFGGPANNNGLPPLPPATTTAAAAGGASENGAGASTSSTAAMRAGTRAAAAGGRPRSGSRDEGNKPNSPRDADEPAERVSVFNIAANPASGDDPNNRDTAGHITLPVFLAYWRAEMQPYDHVERFFRLVKRRDAPIIAPVDFMPFLEELLAFHPGLAFLENTPEFQEKYARTVIARIFYVLDPTAKRALDSRAIRRSNLLDAFHTVDVEEDINLVNDYFSYEVRRARGCWPGSFLPFCCSTRALPRGSLLLR